MHTVNGWVTMMVDEYGDDGYVDITDEGHDEEITEAEYWGDEKDCDEEPDGTMTAADHALYEEMYGIPYWVMNSGEYDDDNIIDESQG